MKIKVKCRACGGTGLYCGMAEPKGVAVVCVQCEGTGGHDFEYEPFVARVPRKGIQTVQRARGTSILGCGPTGPAITYDEFCRGKMP